jgi:putative heme-binding domain-containing protein
VNGAAVRRGAWPVAKSASRAGNLRASCGSGKICGLGSLRAKSNAGAIAHLLLPDGNLAVAFVDFNPDVLQGSPEGGVVGYEKGGCIACHTFGPIGREFGPDLSTIHQRFSRRDLVRAVTHPSETVSDLCQIEEITLVDGRTVAGTIYREDGTSVVVQIPGSAHRETIPRAQIRARVRSEQSAMPEGLLTLLNSRERRNLFLLLQAGPDAIPDTALTRLGASR